MRITLNDGTLSAWCVKISKVSKKTKRGGGSGGWMLYVPWFSAAGSRLMATLKVRCYLCISKHFMGLTSSKTQNNEGMQSSSRNG